MRAVPSWCAHSLLAAVAMASLAALPAEARSRSAPAPARRPTPPAAGGATPVSARISFSQDRPARPGPLPRWTRALPALADSHLRTVPLPCGINNGATIQSLLASLPRRSAQQEYSIALVPGSSERMGHHKAWTRSTVDRHWVEPEFRARLRHAFLLLYEGIVHTVVISGASIDADKPEYNEAIYGFREMVDEYGQLWRGSPHAGRDRLEQRLIVDPWAVHSQTNIRNGDRVTLYAGLERNLVVSTAGRSQPGNRLGYTQGWWFSHHHSAAPFSTVPPFSWIPIGSMDSIAMTSMGYHLGAFGELPDGGADAFGSGTASRANVPRIQEYTGTKGHPAATVHAGYVRTVVIAHWHLNSAAVLADRLWDVGAHDNDAVRAPDTAAIGRACQALRSARH